MGGGASKQNYVMVTDRLLTNEYYQKVESAAPARLKKGQSLMAMSTDSERRSSEIGQLKKGASEKITSERRKTEVPRLKKGKTETSLSSITVPSVNGRVHVSARLPWLVKDATIQSATAGERLKYGKIIGRGLMGTVRVCELDVGKFVAVKTVSKKYIRKHNDMRHITSERDILKKMTSPFCIRLFGTYQDADNIHLVLEYAPGGELFRRLSRRDCFPSNVAKFYTCEVFLALDHVQNLGYVFRDLKPENVMLDEYGHCKLIDFGFAMMPNDDGLCTTNVGTPAYLSPEQLNGKFTKGYSNIVDWWALGIFLYELLTSKTPFCNSFSESSFEIYTRVLKGKIKYPGKCFNKESKALVSSLLDADVKRRLVNPRLIEKHPFFADVDWKAVRNRQVIPPFTPRLPTEAVTDEVTVCHFDDWGRDDKPPPKAMAGKKYNGSMDPDFYEF